MVLRESSKLEPTNREMPARVPYSTLCCKFCGSQNIIRYGTFRGVQRLLCKDCGRKFADNDALPYMQTPVAQVGAALGMYYEGQSLDAIRRSIGQIYNAYPSDSTVYRWLARFTKEGLAKAESVRPNVGDVWVADETVLDLDNEKVWFWDIIDAKTRFLLASHMSRKRTTRDAQALMELAAKRAGKSPHVVVTDKMAGYLDGIELAYGAETSHIASKPFTVDINTNLIERFHGSLKGRMKVMRGLRDMESAKLITDGWLLHYNYFRPHEAIGKTPAEAAGVHFPFRNWTDIVANASLTVQKHSPIAVTTRPEVAYPVRTKDGFKIVPKKRYRPRAQRRQPMPTLSGVRL